MWGFVELRFELALGLIGGLFDGFIEVGVVHCGERSCILEGRKVLVGLITRRKE